MINHIIALIADFVIWVIFALEIGGLYSFSEYSWKTKQNIWWICDFFI